MQWLKDTVEIVFWRLAQKIIRKSYGANCKTPDYEDFGGDHPRELSSASRCGSCRAKEVIDWIEQHIKLITY